MFHQKALRNVFAPPRAAQFAYRLLIFRILRIVIQKEQVSKLNP